MSTTTTHDRVTTAADRDSYYHEPSGDDQRDTVVLPTGELARDGQRLQYGASTDYKLLVSGNSVGIARRTADYPDGMTWELMTHLQWDTHDGFRAWLQDTNSDVVFKKPTPSLLTRLRRLLPV